MGRSIICVVIAAMGMLGSGVDSEGRGLPTLLSVNVALRFIGRTPSSALLTKLELETDAIWRAYGVDISWNDDDRFTADLEFDTIIEARALVSEPAYGVGPLGATRIQREASRRVPIHLFFQPTERMLNLVSVADRFAALGHQRVDDGELGRALGRILAHEIGHVLLAAPYHSPRGLMRAQFSGSELLVRHRELYQLSDAEVDRLEHRAYAIRHLAD